MSGDKSIHRTATQFRSGILEGRPSTRMCDAVCYPLQGWLSFTGQAQTEVASGWFKIDGGELEHVWLVLPDGRILDPTADQLRLFGYPKLPAVYIGPKLTETTNTKRKNQ